MRGNQIDCWWPEGVTTVNASFTPALSADGGTDAMVCTAAFNVDEDGYRSNYFGVSCTNPATAEKGRKLMGFADLKITSAGLASSLFEDGNRTFGQPERPAHARRRVQGADGAAVLRGREQLRDRRDHLAS